MNLKKMSALGLIVLVALGGCRDDDEKVNRTKKGGGAIVESNPEVASVGFAECGAQITDIMLNQNGTIVFPANTVDEQGMIIESQEAIPVLQATVGFVLRNEGGTVRLNGRITGDSEIAAQANSVTVDLDGGNAVLNFPLDGIDRQTPVLLNFDTIAVDATHTRLDNETFGPCQGSRAINLQIEVPEPLMTEQML